MVRKGLLRLRRILLSREGRSQPGWIFTRTKI